MGRGNKSATTSSNKWRCCHPTSYYYLKYRPNCVALLFIASVSVSLFVWDIQTLLKQHQGLLAFYDLPQPHSLVEVKVKPSSSLPYEVKFELHTLPVDAKAVWDGDTLTVYVRITKPWESSFVPSNVCIAAMQRSEARARRDYKEADSFHKQIIHAGYRVLNFQNEEILARKYRIRLRGIDAPEGSMPYGKEAKNELIKVIQGKSLGILVYGEDYYGRCVGDIYCDGIFVQELMLKKGLAWHYTAYDKRPELEKIGAVRLRMVDVVLRKMVGSADGAKLLVTMRTMGDVKILLQCIGAYFPKTCTENDEEEMEKVNGGCGASEDGGVSWWCASKDGGVSWWCKVIGRNEDNG